MPKTVSHQAAETRKIAALLAREAKNSSSRRPLIFALQGNLGAGKTTFTQGFARALGIKEKVLSPSFVLVKIYKILRGRKKRLIHIDCYRLRGQELAHLGLKNFLSDQDAIIIVEWAEKIKKLLPKNAIWIRFAHGKKQNERVLRIFN